jgi:hypothetical protein
VVQHGGRTPTTRGTAAAADGGCGKEDRRPEQGTQHNETAQSAFGGGTAPMRRVHDKADERVNGTWVGRSSELVEKPTAAAAAGC